MTDKELFLKYNLTPTDREKKDDNLTEKLYNNEYKFNTPSFHRSLLVLLHGSYACNCNCVYCENHKLREKYGNTIINEEVLEALVSKLGPIIREITWHGGEPLLIPEEKIKFLEDLKIKYNYNFTTTLQTNSILLTEDKVKFLDNLEIEWGTSFDGLKNSISRGEKSTEAILDLISREQNRVGFIGVTYSDTIDDLIENYNYYKTLGISGMQSCIVRENVLENTNKYLVKNNIAVGKMLEYIDYWIHDINSPIRDDYIVRQINRVLGKTNLCEDGYCIGGWVIVDPFGNIGLCGHAADEDTICNVLEIDSYKDLINSKKYLSLLGKQAKLDIKCKSCEWYNVCHGGCMGLNYEQDHTYNTVNTRNCEYIKKLLTGIYELIKDIDISRYDLYNPIFLDLLKENNYYSLSEIKKIEERHG